jgi:hypothetical protein
MENPSSGPDFPSWYRFNEVSSDYFFFLAAFFLAVFFLAFFLAGILSHLHPIIWVHDLRVEQNFVTVKRNFHFYSTFFGPFFYRRTCVASKTTPTINQEHDETFIIQAECRGDADKKRRAFR